MRPGRSLEADDQEVLVAELVAGDTAFREPGLTDGADRPGARTPASVSLRAAAVASPASSPSAIADRPSRAATASVVRRCSRCLMSSDVNAARISAAMPIAGRSVKQMLLAWISASSRPASVRPAVPETIVLKIVIGSAASSCRLTRRSWRVFAFRLRRSRASRPTAIKVSSPDKGRRGALPTACGPTAPAPGDRRQRSFATARGGAATRFVV